MASDRNKRTILVSADFGDGYVPQGSATEIRPGLVLTARHVLYRKGERAKSIRVRWWESRDEGGSTATDIVAEDEDLDVALIECAGSPDDIRLPPAALSRCKPCDGMTLFGSGFPVLTDLGNEPGRNPVGGVVCDFHDPFAVLRDCNEITFSREWLSRKLSEEIDRAFSGASGTGLFAGDGTFVAVFLARNHENTTNKNVLPVNTILAIPEFAAHIFPKGRFEAIDTEIERLLALYSDLAHIGGIETEGKLDAILATLNGETDRSRFRDYCDLAILLVARGCDEAEIEGLRENLEAGAKFLDIGTWTFGGAERRMAAAEDRAAAYRNENESRDLTGTHCLVRPPDPGIDGESDDSDLEGILGLDLILNRELDKPWPHDASTDLRREKRVKAICGALALRLADGHPRYYRAALEDEPGLANEAVQVRERYAGLVPFLKLGLDDNADTGAEEDARIMRKLIEIMKLVGADRP